MSDFWEIVELVEGEIALQKADSEEILLTVKLSDNLKQKMPDQYVEVAKAMLSAGMQMVSELSEQEAIKQMQELADSNVH